MRSLVDDVKEKLDIVDIISGYLKVTPAGANFRGLCPFHREKTPSFMVNRERQIFHCFGCGKGGDVITFIEEMEGMEFKEALRLLAERAGLDLRQYQREGFSSDAGEKKEALRRCLEASAVFYEGKLYENKGKQALDYLIGRGLTKETIKNFRLGFALSVSQRGNPTALFEHLRGMDITPETIVASGSVYKKDGQEIYVDRFRGRVIFPIADNLGKVVGFSARLLPGSDSLQGKYINTSQTLLYDKSNLLYGFHLAKKAIREEKEIILLEGNLDVILSHQAGVAHAVATCGTALSAKQLIFLRRYSERLVLAFDADMAGVKATKRAGELAFLENFDVKVVPIAQGKDVADVAKENPEKWRQMVKKRKGLASYFFNLAFKNRVLTLDQKKVLAEKILKLLSQLPSQVEQSHFITRLSEEVNVPENLLWEKINQLQRQKKPDYRAEPISEKKKESEGKKNRQYLIEKRILGLMVSFPKLYLEYEDSLKGIMFADAFIGKVWGEIKNYLEKNISGRTEKTEEVENIQFSSRDLEIKTAEIGLEIGKEFEGDWEEVREGVSRELENCLGVYRKEILGERRRELMKEISQLKKEGRESELNRLMEELEKISKEAVGVREKKIEKIDE